MPRALQFIVFAIVLAQVELDRVQAETYVSPPSEPTSESELSPALVLPELNPTVELSPVLEPNPVDNLQPIVELDPFVDGLEPPPTPILPEPNVVLVTPEPVGTQETEAVPWSTPGSAFEVTPRLTYPEPPAAREPRSSPPAAESPAAPAAPTAPAATPVEPGAAPARPRQTTPPAGRSTRPTPPQPTLTPPPRTATPTPTPVAIATPVTPEETPRSWFWLIAAGLAGAGLFAAKWLIELGAKPDLRFEPQVALGHQSLQTQGDQPLKLDISFEPKIVPGNQQVGTANHWPLKLDIRFVPYLAKGQQKIQMSDRLIQET